jgi:hypothetical protein
VTISAALRVRGRRASLVGVGALLALSPVVLAAGCDDTVDGDLSATTSAGGELVIDDVCSPSCGGSDSLDVQVSYAAEKTPQQGDVQLAEYRVDFTLPGVTGTVPFYAGTTTYALSPGKQATQTLLVVGTTQRQFVQQAIGSQSVAGTAKLTLAGYDFDNRQVFVTTTFAVRFGPISGPAPVVDAGAGDGS